jgi:hypothetical protein
MNYENCFKSLAFNIIGRGRRGPVEFCAEHMT